MQGLSGPREPAGGTIGPDGGVPDPWGAPGTGERDSSPASPVRADGRGLPLYLQTLTAQ